MTKLALSALLVMVIALILACGSDPTATTAPTAVPPTEVPTQAPAAAAPTQAAAMAEPTATRAAAQGPAPTATSAAPAMSSQLTGSAALQAAAAERAGGPGAFYIGDLSQLVGPAPAEGLGDANDQVNLAGLERESYLFDSQYYRDLVAKANFENPTQMTYDGDPIEIQFACINRTVAPCELWEAFFVPQIQERTNGKLLIPLTSFPELGIAGPDSLDQITSGTLSFAEITGGYVSGHMPEAEIALLYGLYPDHEVEFKVTQAIQPEIDRLFVENTEGGQVISHMWVSGGDQFFFCQDPITDLEGFEGKKVRSHGSALSDWIEGFGADAQFVAFAEVYTALERGILDCGVTVAFAAHGQRWYEVSDYMMGPLSSQLLNTAIISEASFNRLPPDLQQILLEEGARHELEAMRVTPGWNEVWTQRNIDAGLEYVPFSDALMEHQRNVAAMQHVLPGFVNRVGGGESPIIALFNEKIAPIVGVGINPDGTTRSVPITQ